MHDAGSKKQVASGVSSATHKCRSAMAKGSADRVRGTRYQHDKWAGITGIFARGLGIFCLSSICADRIHDAGRTTQDTQQRNQGTGPTKGVHAPQGPSTHRIRSPDSFACLVSATGKTSLGRCNPPQPFTLFRAHFTQALSVDWT